MLGRRHLPCPGSVGARRTTPGAHKREGAETEDHDERPCRYDPPPVTMAAGGLYVDAATAHASPFAAESSWGMVGPGELLT